MKCEILEALTNYTRKTMTEAEYRRYTARKELLAEEVFEEKSDIFINLHLSRANMGKQLHGHDFFELNYVLSGECTQTLGSGEQLLLKEGSLCILNPNARHSLNIENDSNIILNILIKKSLFNSTFWSLIEQHEHIGPFFLSYFLSQDKSSNFLIFNSSLTPDLVELTDRICGESLNKPL